MHLKKILLMLIISIAGVLLIAAVNNYSLREKIENFTLKDYNGKDHSLSDYKDSKAVVIMFIATECPVSNAYNSRMENIYKNYSQKNVAFIGINSNKAESVDRIKEHAKENGLTFTILKDEKNVIADRF